jgi:ferredoxin
MRVHQTARRRVNTNPSAQHAAAGRRKISSSAMLSEADHRMRELGVDRLPVIEYREIVGAIARDDIAEAVRAGMDPSTTPVKSAMKTEASRETTSKEKPMKARVTDDCISCGRCVEICPEVFEMGDDKAFVKVDTIPEEFQDAAQEAAGECPTSAIIIENG